MNKKLFILLPAAALMLAGCGQTSEDSSSASESDTQSETTTTPDESESTTTSEEEIDEVHGTADHPLSVADLITNVAAEVAAESGVYSDVKFYVEGYLDKNANMGASYFDTFFLHDDPTDSKSFKVQRAIKGSGFTSNKLYQNDKVVVGGYVEYFNGGYSFFPLDADSPEILKRELGTSSFSVSVDEHSHVTSSYNATYANESVVELEVSVDSGYKIEAVKVNGAELVESSGVYAATVEGNTSVVITSVLDVTETKPAAGTYTVNITYANAGLPDAAGSADVTTKFSYVADTAEVVYQKFAATWSAGGYINSSYEEFFIAAKGTLVLDAGPGKITALTVVIYNTYDNLIYYSGEGIEGDEIAHTHEKTTGHNKESTDTVSISGGASVVTLYDSYTGTVGIYSLTATVVID